jgi:hypothetical protein
MMILGNGDRRNANFTSSLSISISPSKRRKRIITNNNNTEMTNTTINNDFNLPVNTNSIIRHGLNNIKFVL